MNHRIFLSLSILLTAFLLWSKWQVHNAPIVTETRKETPNTPQQDLPVLSKESAQDVPEATTFFVNASTGDPSIIIETDLLTLEVSKLGATILSVNLNNYPLSLGSDETFELLSNQPGRIFHAQSGLLPNEIFPTHHSRFETEADSYIMTGDVLSVPFVWSQNGIEVLKTFNFERGSYSFSVEYEVANKTSNALVFTDYTQFKREAIEESSLMLSTFAGGATYNDEEIFEKIDFEDFTKRQSTSSKAGWGAMVQHYFLAAAIPQPERKITYQTRVDEGMHFLSLVAQAQTVPAGETHVARSVDFYIGPKEQQRINAIAGLDKTVDYGILFIIASPLAKVLGWIYTWAQSWGLSIIILTLFIKVLFYKLSEKSYQSMAGMRKLAPRLEQLKQNYGNDKQLMGQKTMELYRQEKINPASGCLPILIQIPVFIALYWVLLEMVELRQTSFLYVPDLSNKDPYFVLPLLMGLSMWAQQRLNPKPTDPTQARIMAALPVVFTIFFLWFPAGLVLYWVTNNTLSILQQWIINKRLNA